MKTFNIIDPGMTGKFGHHREINFAVGQELRQRGYQVNIFSHKKYIAQANDPIDQTFKVIPYFSINPYAVYSNVGSDIDLFIKHQNSEFKFHQEFNSIDLEGDIHFSNLFSYQLKTIAQINKKFNASACIHIHPNRDTHHGEYLWKKTMVEINQQLHNFKIFAIEELLLHEIDRMTSHGQGVKKYPFH